MSAPRGIVAPHLKAWRRKKLLKQWELAEKAGVARATIVRGERGGTLSLDNLRKLADALGITPEQLRDTSPNGE